MRSSSGLLSLLVAVASAGGAACGSVATSNDGSVDAAPPTVAQACGQFAATLCARLNGCAPYALQLFYGDMTTCESRVTLGCSRDLEVPDTNQTTTDMVTCARDAANSTCDDLVANVFPASCQIKPGVRVNGEGCGSSWQCTSTHCEKTDGDCGVCAPRAAANGACTVDEGCARRPGVRGPEVRRAGGDGRARAAPRRRAAPTSIAARPATRARRRWAWARRARAIPARAICARASRATSSRPRPSARPSPPRRRAHRAASSTGRSRSASRSMPVRARR